MVLYVPYRTMDTGCSVLCLGLAEWPGRTMLIAGIPHEELRHTRDANRKLLPLPSASSPAAAAP